MTRTVPRRSPWRWWIAGIAGVCTVIAGAMVFAIAGPRPEPVEGRDRPDWLPAAATRVHHRSQGGFGWWRVARFRISEADFREHAARHGWELEDTRDFLVGFARQLEPQGQDLPVLRQALVHQRLARNHGGRVVAFDPETSTAWYSESHR